MEVFILGSGNFKELIIEVRSCKWFQCSSQTCMIDWSGIFYLFWTCYDHNKHVAVQTRMDFLEHPSTAIISSARSGKLRQPCLLRSHRTVHSRRETAVAKYCKAVGSAMRHILCDSYVYLGFNWAEFFYLGWNATLAICFPPIGIEHSL